MNSAYIERRRMEEVLHRHGFRFQKKYGQNFLVDPGIPEAIVEAAGVGEDDTVLEIGPGMGTMTVPLAKRAKKVIAVEIDDHLIPVLEEELERYNNVEIIRNDIMKMSLDDIFPKVTENGAKRIVANLPYYITTPILMKLLESGMDYTSITVMVQREVAERMTASPGTKSYGALTLAVSYYTNPRIDFTIEPDSFFPPPKVDSTVITLTKHANPPVEVDDEKLLFDLIRASFNQRRKTLVNGISHGMNLGLSKDEISEILVSLGHSPTVRGEALSLEQFAEIAQRLAAYHKLGANTFDPDIIR